MASFTGNPNFTATGTGAATRSAADVLDEFVFASGFTGYDPTGVSDSHGAIMAAIAVAQARNRTLILQGTPRISSTISLDYPVRWRMDGTHFLPGQLGGGSYLIKDRYLDGPAIVFEHDAQGSVIENLAIIGEQAEGELPGNGGDGIVIFAPGVTLRNCSIQGMGRDGCRIGGYDPGDDYYDAIVGVNANAFLVDNFAAAYNGRHGLHISDDKGGAVIDANAGAVIQP